MKRIAIVDDSDINLTLLKALLFKESPRGLAWCVENLPDLIIDDDMMPDLDGMQFLFPTLSSELL